MKFIIDMPASWKPAMCPDCHIQYSGVNGICGLAVCPLANAKEAVEVDPEIQSVEIGLPVPEAPFKVMMVDNEQVTLYAIKETK